MSLFVHESLAGKLEMILLKAIDTEGIRGETGSFIWALENKFSGKPEIETIAW